MNISQLNFDDGLLLYLTGNKEAGINKMKTQLQQQQNEVVRDYLQEKTRSGK